MNKSPCLEEENFSMIAKHLLIQRSHQCDEDLAEQQELKLEECEHKTLNRMRNTASHTGLFLTVLCGSNRSGLCESPSHEDVRDTVKGAGIQTQRQQTGNSVWLSLLLPLSLTHRGSCLAVPSPACKPGLVHGAGRTQGNWQGGRHGHFSDFREKTPLSLVEHGFQGPHPPAHDQHWCWFCAPSPVNTNFFVYTRGGGPQA